MIKNTNIGKLTINYNSYIEEKNNNNATAHMIWEAAKKYFFSGAATKDLELSEKGNICSLKIV